MANFILSGDYILIGSMILLVYSVCSTAADAVQRGLSVTVIQDWLGYESEEKHEQAVGQVVDLMGVERSDSESLGMDMWPSPYQT